VEQKSNPLSRPLRPLANRPAAFTPCRAPLRSRVPPRLQAAPGSASTPRQPPLPSRSPPRLPATMGSASKPGATAPASPAGRAGRPLILLPPLIFVAQWVKDLRILPQSPLGLLRIDLLLRGGQLIQSIIIDPWIWLNSKSVPLCPTPPSPPLAGVT
jgi:hypothetical protein